MRQMLTSDDIAQQSLAYRGTGGVSVENRAFGFLPAFLDRESGQIHLSCDARGIPAAVHQFDGMPADWIVKCGRDGKPCAVKASIVAGFVREGYFFTREQAAQLIQWELDKAPV
jgi:hypothetical protein